MGKSYPELSAAKNLASKVIKEEEDAFLRTLDKGIGMLDEHIKNAKSTGKTQINGKDAFILYDTYGFPLDLTELILRENGMSVDIEQFNAEMERQKTRARNAAATETADWVEVHAEGEEQFVGYDHTECDTRILRYRKVKQKNKEYYHIILSDTPFYAEMGGQVGDKGLLIGEDGEKIEIFDTKKENNIGVHLSREIPANPAQKFHAVIDTEARMATSANHSATHLLHEALRDILGTHVEQKGSYVSPDILRFDFSHFQKVTNEELRKVEHLVNSRIRKATLLEEHREMPIDEARKIGAMALFGEKYGDKVRVVKYASSVELCGGTHVPNTGNIGMLRILSESSIAAGIRRIEAVTGHGVEKLMDAMQDTARDMQELLGNASDMRQAVVKAINENADLKHQVEEFFKERVANQTKALLDKPREINGVKVIEIQGPKNPDVVKNVAFAIRAASTESTVFVASTIDASNKPLLTIMLSDDIVKEGYNAGKIIREAAKNIKGGGGGQPFFAQAGGKDADGLSKAHEDILKALHLK